MMGDNNLNLLYSALEKNLTDQTWSQFTPEDIQEAKQNAERKDISFLKEFMNKKLNQWKEQDLNCGITGNSGSGKSSFINAIRNLRGQDKGAAAVGITETTKKPTPYKDPRNPKIVYWDLPGVGTKNFRRNDYLEKVFFSRYDFFIIVSSCRFTENDEWLAMQIQKAGKKFFFVRTKLDQDLANQKREYPNSYSEENVRELLKNTSLEDLEWEGDENPQVYLISNHHQHMYDFPKLMVELLNSLPLLKQEALTLSIHAFSNEIVAEKKKVLSRRIVYLSALSAIGGAVPVPGLSAFVDLGIIMNEISVYRTQFGLEDDDLKKHLNKDDVTKLMKDLSSKENILNLIKKFYGRIVFEEAMGFVPILGFLASGIISFYTTQKMLLVILEKFGEIAVIVLEHHFDDAANDNQLD